MGEGGSYLWAPAVAHFTVKNEKFYSSNDPISPSSYGQN